MNWKILIVDDEPSLTALLRRQFTDCGYTVFVANNSSEAMNLLKEQPDIILLDINMPGKDGLAFCQEIRESVSCPILFLTARIMEQDKLAGFRDGGDDYITKPFSLAELTARVEAHLRREQRNRIHSNCLTSHGLTADLTARELSFEGEAIAFTKKEFDIIELLWTNSNQVFDKEHIYESVWGLEANGNNSVVKEHIRKIRAKLLEMTKWDFIETIWGIGYKWKK